MGARVILAVTGALGFLGHHFVNAALIEGHRCWLVDAETYAADLSHLEHWDERLVQYVKADIVTLSHLPDVDVVINFAAETHVDNSVLDSRKFMCSNVLGVHNLLELVHAKRNYEMPRFLQISTDEVYGSVGTGTTDEATPLAPSSPYAASKAAADLLVQSYAATYGLKYNIVRPSNCYGAGQYPEKLIPKAIRYFSQGKPMPVHDTGEHLRSWLAVEDCAAAVLAALRSGAPNEVYNVGGNTLASVITVVNAISEHFEKPQVQMEYKRAGVDHRYCVSDTKLQGLGWKPQGSLFRDLPRLIDSEKTAFRW